MKRLNLRRFVRQTRGAAVIEFALVVPILFMMVWGIISFTRGYQRMNALTAALREGARAASTMDSVQTDPGARRVTQIKNTIANFSSAFGYTVDVNLVNVSISTRIGPDGQPESDVTVSVTNYPLFTGINFIGNLQSVTISRQAIFRCERNCDD